MGRTKGTYTLTSNIEPKVGAPLDARTIVKLLADLTASNTFEYPYKGMKVFVEENNKSYTLVGSDSTVSTNWIEDNSGGHTIKNSAGTAMTQRSNLQFVDLTVTDDSTNDITKVENIHVIQSESELENLPDGLYMLDDDEGTVIDGNEVGYDNTDSGLNAENVQDAIDEVVETLDDKIDISAKGVANGVAELDSTGKVPSSQLPSFVDDVIEVADYDHLPATGETGKIYVTLDTNKTYRWGGTEYVEISESLALGETSSTAYRGDRGKVAYDHSQLTSGNPHNVTKSEVGLGNVDNTSDSTKKTNFTGSIASGNTGFVTGGDAYTALSGKADKVTSATNGNLAGLNATGNPTDSGISGDMTTQSASGNPISIPNLKSAQIALNPVITFEPIQAGSGTPSPVNQRPISGYDKIEVLSCGKNILEGEIANCAIDSNGLIYASSTTKMGYAKVGQGKTYTVKTDDSTLIGGLFLTKPAVGSTTYNGARIVGAAGDYTFTAPITGYIAFRCTSAYTTLQIEEGSTSTTYKAPVKTTDLSESLGQTVYGCKVYPRTGELDNSHSIIDMGDMSWTRIYTGNNYYLRSTISDAKYEGVFGQRNACCSCYGLNSSGTSMPLNGEFAITGAGYSGSLYVLVRDDNYTDASVFTTAVTGQKICYELTTHTTIQLTPHEIALSQGYNYISTNGTSISLAYHNGELASLADVSQLGETVNELGDYVGANNLGSQNAIVIPETGNFICPSDGYVVVRSGNNASDFYRVDVYGSQKVSTNRFIIKVNATPDTASKYQYFSVYVRKGMIVTFAEKSSGNTTGGANFVTIE